MPVNVRTSPLKGATLQVYVPVAKALTRFWPGAYTSTQRPKSLKYARLRQSVASAPTEMMPGNAAGQLGRLLALFPAGTTHATPLCCRRSSSQAWKAISG